MASVNGRVYACAPLNRSRIFVMLNLLLGSSCEILPAHNKRVLRTFYKPPLIEETIVRGRHAHILGRCARPQFPGELVHERFNLLEPRIGISIFRAEKGADPWVSTIAKPIIRIDTHTTEFFERLRLDRSYRWGGRGG